MRVWMSGFILAWAPVVAVAEASIEDVIGAQISAFQQDDFAGAFAYASPTIQGIFGGPDRFGEMVRQGYPMVWRPEDVRYLERREIAGRVWQRVMVRDTKGVLHMLDYQMVQVDGMWRINAVQLLQMPGAGA
ncbi:DUF4864 domain-containing protein [Shimia sp. CNT1-13L.2]|uniref:DUF4864 domain-containing protein n=1 Tax=Shimia sp. CNT1-13L.2 TaxID=2959663 RepID=UPI0020CE17DE|nr:DUF4864 domain-containing protein [Shimia sp. CNT1-13L.2]MCP9480386.1 DUF4864 domain-containing protein [Shimia sp. CNT1-13L.2]